MEDDKYAVKVGVKKCPDCGRELVQRDMFVEDDRETYVVEYEDCKCGASWNLVFNEERDEEQLVLR